MKKYKTSILTCFLLSALALLSSFCGLWNSYMKSYCEPIVLYPMENGTGIYDELPPYAPYYTSLGTYSYLTTGNDINELNSVCAEISDDYRKFYAYDASNLFSADIKGNNTVAYFADNNALKYFKTYIVEGENINPTCDKPEVLVGGKNNRKTKIGDNVIVTVTDKKNTAYHIECIVVGKIDETVSLPADANFTPNSYYTQQDSLVVLNQTVKYERGLQYDNRFFVRIVDVKNVARPADYTFINVTDYFTERGYPSITKTNSEMMSVSSLYFSFALTKLTLSSGNINVGQIYYILLILLISIFCVLLPIIMRKKMPKLSHYSTIIVFAIIFSLCSFAFVIAKYGSGLGLLNYSDFIAYPLLFSGITVIATTITKIVELKKQRLAEIYIEE